MTPFTCWIGRIVTPKYHDDVIKWKRFPRYWPFVRGIHGSPVNSPHKGQWPGALMFCLICAWINGWVNNREAGDFGRHRAHYDVIVMTFMFSTIDQHWYTVGGESITVGIRLCYKINSMPADALATHYHDVIMSEMASQITRLTIVTTCSIQ